MNCCRLKLEGAEPVALLPLLVLAAAGVRLRPVAVLVVTKEEITQAAAAAAVAVIPR